MMKALLVACCWTAQEEQFNARDSLGAIGRHRVLSLLGIAGWQCGGAAMFQSSPAAALQSK